MIKIYNLIRISNDKMLPYFCLFPCRMADKPNIISHCFKICVKNKNTESYDSKGYIGKNAHPFLSFSF